MTDFFALPGDYADLPPSRPSQTPSVPRTSGDVGIDGRIDVSEVDWDYRAKVARAGAEDLREAMQILAATLPSNYFGRCEEGENVYRTLSDRVTRWRSDLRAQIESLNALASQCSAAARQYNETDNDAAHNLTT